MNDHVGSVVAVAWNGSPQAVRAVGAALPILATADAITVITVGDRKPGDDGLREYLAWHGITAKFRSVPAVHGRSTGALLLDTASEADADILVMGGYGHRPWREALFGGVTRDILAQQQNAPFVGALRSRLCLAKARDRRTKDIDEGLPRCQ